MTEKTREQLEEILRVEEITKREREISDRMYARKIAETILFSLVGMFCIAIVSALIKVVVQ